MAAPQGNQNAVRAKKWREAIMRALSRKAGSVDQGLDQAADQLVSLAIDDADHWAIDHLADRLDGKVAQAIVGGDDDSPPIRIARIELVALSGSGSDPDSK